MATLSQERVREAIRNRPPGTTPEGVVAGLREQGAELEGFQQTQTTSSDVQQKSTTAQTTAQADTDAGVTLGDAASFMDTLFGGGKIGEAIGNEIARGTFGDTIQRIVVGQDLSPEQEQRVEQDVTGTQLAGSALKAGVTAGSAGAGGLAARGVSRGAQLLSKVPGVSRFAQGIARTGGAMIGGATGGGAVGAAEELEQEGQAPAGEEVAQGAIGGATGGAIVGTAFNVAPGALNKSARSLFSKVFQKSKKQGLAELQGRFVDPTDIALDELGAGTKKSLLNKADKKVSQFSDEIQNIVNKTEGGVDTQSVLDDAVQATADDFDGNLSAEKIQSFIESSDLPLEKLRNQEALGIAEANKLRSILDREFLGDTKWLSQTPDNAKVKFIKNLANNLRSRVQASNSQLPDKFNNLQAMISAKTLLESDVASRPSALRRFIDNGLLIGGIGGLASGGDPTFPLIVGGISVADIAAQSGLPQSSVATALNKLSRVTGKAPQTFTRQEIINAITGEQEQPQQQTQ